MYGRVEWQVGQVARRVTATYPGIQLTTACKATDLLTLTPGHQTLTLCRTKKRETPFMVRPLLCRNQGDSEALLPDRWVAAHPKHRLEQREEESREAQARRRRKRAHVGLLLPNRRW